MKADTKTRGWKAKSKAQETIKIKRDITKQGTTSQRWKLFRDRAGHWEDQTIKYKP